MNNKLEKKIIWFLCVFALFLIFFVTWENNFKNEKIYNEQILESQNRLSFIAENSEVQGISLSEDGRASVSEEEGDNIISVCIFDEEQTLIWNTEVSVENVGSNEFGNIIDLSDNKISLVNGDCYRAEVWFCGKQLTNFSLILYGDDSSPLSFYLLVCSIVVLICALVVVSVKSHKTNYYVMFFLILFSFGILENVVMGQLRIPDEQTHFSEAYELSNIILGKENDDYEVSIFESGVERLSQNSTLQGMYHYLFSSSYGNNFICSQSNKYVINKSIPIYEYFPSAVGISLARIMKLPYQLIFIFGRMFNLTFLALCAMLSMVIYKPYKYAIAAICFLPSTIWIVASYSYDVWNLAFCFLFVSSCLRIRNNNRNIRLTDLFLLAVILLALVPVKIIYGIFALMVILIPFDKMRNMKKIEKVSVILSLFFVFLTMCLFRGKEILSYFFTQNMDRSGLDGAGGSLSYTMQWVVTHPVNSVLVYLNTIYHYFEYELWKCVIGESYYRYIPPSFIMILTLFTFMIIMSISLAGERLTIVDRRKAFILFVIDCFTVLTTFLFAFSTIQYPNVGAIEGMQGRYFIPFLLILPLIIKSNRIKEILLYFDEKIHFFGSSKNIGEKLIAFLQCLSLFIIFYTFKS